MKFLRLFILFSFMATCVAAAQDTSAPAVPNVPVEKDTGAPSADTLDEGGSNSPLIRPSDKNASLYTIELRDTPLLDIFRLMARDYGLNIVVDDKITGTITASLSDIGLEEALQTIVDMKNLKIEKKGKIIIIRPNLISKIFVLHHLRLGSVVSVDTTASTTSSSQSTGVNPAASVAGPQPAASASADNKEASATTSTTTGKIIFQKLLSPDGYVIPDV